MGTLLLDFQPGDSEAGGARGRLPMQEAGKGAVLVTSPAGGKKAGENLQAREGRRLPGVTQHMEWRRLL